jgi:hypothetical protein
MTALRRSVVDNRLSERSISALLDLIEGRVRDLDAADSQDMRDLQTLEQCRRELKALRTMVEAPQEVMRRARLAGIL